MTYLKKCLEFTYHLVISMATAFVIVTGLFLYFALLFKWIVFVLNHLNIHAL